MLKRLLILAFAGLLSPAHGAGTIPYSLSQQFDQFGHVLAGCRLNIIRAGTTSTPQNAYQDSALTIPLPNPVICDAAGRLPQLFIADGSIKIRLTDRNGVNQVTADGILVIGPSGGGGGGSTVDPTTIIATGDYKLRHGTGVLSGFVRANGRTIGSATSGATERANADCEALFEYLWDTDANLSVSTGRGASSAADWAANKTIALPDWRGRAPAGLDDMGNSAAGRLTATYFGTAATVLGAAGGSQTNAGLVTANLPPYTPAGSVSVTSATMGNGTGSFFLNNTGILQSATGGGALAGYAVGSATQQAVVSTGTLTGTAQGGTSTVFSIVSPRILTTVYLKL